MVAAQTIRGPAIERLRTDFAFEFSSLGSSSVLSVRMCGVGHHCASRVGRLPSQMMDLLYPSGHGKDWRGWVALIAEGAISAPVYMIITNVVFAGKGVFEIPGALVQGCAFGAATVSIVHTGSHLGLTFHYGCKRTTI
jgi:hypothetical protein